MYGILCPPAAHLYYLGPRLRAWYTTSSKGCFPPMIDIYVVQQRSHGSGVLLSTQTLMNRILSNGKGNSHLWLIATMIDSCATQSGSTWGSLQSWCAHDMQGPFKMQSTVCLLFGSNTQLSRTSSVKPDRKRACNKFSKVSYSLAESGGRMESWCVGTGVLENSRPHCGLAESHWASCPDFFGPWSSQAPEVSIH